MREFGLIKVEILDPVLKQRNGRFMHVGREMALKGVRRGKWKIVDGTMEDRELLADAGGGDYMTKAGFGSKPKVETPSDRPATLTFSDMYGTSREGEKDGASGTE